MHKLLQQRDEETKKSRYSLNEIVCNNFLQKNIYEILMQFWKVCGVSFIGGGNWSTWRKQPSCHKQLLNIITQWCIEYTSPEWDSKVLTFRSSIRIILNS
jgi:hypothetical protein